MCFRIKNYINNRFSKAMDLSLLSNLKRFTNNTRSSADPLEPSPTEHPPFATIFFFFLISLAFSYIHVTLLFDNKSYLVWFFDFLDSFPQCTEKLSRNCKKNRHFSYFVLTQNVISSLDDILHIML